MSTIKASLLHIAYGSIYFAIEAEGIPLTLHFDTVGFTDFTLVEIIQSLAAGGFPNVRFDRTINEFSVHPVEDAGMCRLVVAESEGLRAGRLDATVDRNDLLAELTGLAAGIADHPCFAHAYLIYGALPYELEVESDLIWDAAEAEWRAGVEAGRFIDDDYCDGEGDFVARKVSAEFPLPADSVAFAEKHRAMLRTLEIPEDWRRS